MIETTTVFSMLRDIPFKTWIEYSLRLKGYHSYVDKHGREWWKPAHEWNNPDFGMDFLDAVEELLELEEKNA